MYFDLWANGQVRRFAWTDPEFHNGFLVLDRNNNGAIDDGSELFGSATPQPEPPSGTTANGFNALAVYDTPERGGNGDGVIDDKDEVFDRLQLWIDENHDGMSRQSELKGLKAAGVYRIDLLYKMSHKTDEYGNAFFYRARVWDSAGRASRLAWDVFLTTVQ